MPQYVENQFFKDKIENFLCLMERKGQLQASDYSQLQVLLDNYSRMEEEASVLMPIDCLSFHGHVLVRTIYVAAYARSYSDSKCNTTFRRLYNYKVQSKLAGDQASAVAVTNITGLARLCR